MSLSSLIAEIETICQATLRGESSRESSSNELNLLPNQSFLNATDTRSETLLNEISRLDILYKDADYRASILARELANTRTTISKLEGRISDLLIAASVSEYVPSSVPNLSMRGTTTIYSSDEIARLESTAKLQEQESKIIKDQLRSLQQLLLESSVASNNNATSSHSNDGNLAKILTTITPSASQYNEPFTNPEVTSTNPTLILTSLGSNSKKLHDENSVTTNKDAEIVPPPSQNRVAFKLPTDSMNNHVGYHETVSSNKSLETVGSDSNIQRIGPDLSFDEDDEDDDDYDDDEDDEDEAFILSQTVESLRRRVLELEIWLDIERLKNSPLQDINKRRLLKENILEPYKARLSMSPKISVGDASPSCSTTEANPMQPPSEPVGMNPADLDDTANAINDYDDYGDDDLFITPAKFLTPTNSPPSKLRSRIIPDPEEAALRQRVSSQKPQPDYNIVLNHKSTQTDQFDHNDLIEQSHIEMTGEISSSGLTLPSLLAERDNLKLENGSLMDRTVILYDQIQDLQRVVKELQQREIERENHQLAAINMENSHVTFDTSANLTSSSQNPTAFHSSSSATASKTDLPNLKTSKALTITSSPSVSVGYTRSLQLPYNFPSADSNFDLSSSPRSASRTDSPSNYPHIESPPTASTSPKVGNRNSLRRSRSKSFRVSRPSSSRLSRSPSSKRGNSRSPNKGSASASQRNSPTKRSFFISDTADQPIVCVEIGTFASRVSLWNNTTRSFDLKFVCRTLKAMATNDKDRLDIVRHAASQSDPMYQNFRDTGYFLGNDALYCCFDHPDVGLRGSLKLLPILKDLHISDVKAYEAIIEYALLKGISKPNGQKIQLLMPYKNDFEIHEIESLINSLFGNLRCEQVCLMSEAILISNSIRNSPKSAVIVDIGSFYTTVHCIYEGIVISHATAITEIGGEHVTDYLALLLHAQQNEVFNGLMPRRCKEIARYVKERVCFVASNFENAQSEYGKFEFSTIQVMGMGLKEHITKANSGNISKKELQFAMNDTSGHGHSNTSNKGTVITPSKFQRLEIVEAVDITLPDGLQMAISLDIERFHSTEIFFTPSLYDETRSATNIVDTIMTCVKKLDESVVSEIASNIILGGGSSAIPGLQTRLRSELNFHVSALGVKNLTVYLSEENERLSLSQNVSPTTAKNLLSGGNTPGSTSASTSPNGFGSNGINHISKIGTYDAMKKSVINLNNSCDVMSDAIPTSVSKGASAVVKTLLSQSRTTATLATNCLISTNDYEERGTSAIVQELLYL